MDSKRSTVICCKFRHLSVVQTIPEGLVTPNLLSYNTALDSMAKSLQWLISLSLFRTLHLQSLVPDIISYSASSPCWRRRGKDAQCTLAPQQELQHLQRTAFY